MAFYRCEICKAKFEQLSKLMKHQRMQGHVLSCNKCRKTFTQKKNLYSHMNRHNDQYNCDQCREVFSSMRNLQRHKHRKHQLGGNAPEENLYNPKADPKQYYVLKKSYEKQIRKFNTTNTTYAVQFKDIEVREVRDILSALSRIIKSLFVDITQFASDDDLIRLNVESPELDYPIVLPFMVRKHLTVDRFLAEIERVLQSHEEFVLDKGLKINVIHARKPIGSGRKYVYATFEQFLQNKKCIIQITNKDELCCARALVTAKAKVDNHSQWHNIRQGYDVQEQLATDLHLLACVPVGSCGMDHLKQFQVWLKDYQIIVVSFDHMNAVIYSGPQQERKLCLYLHNGHYDVITSLAAFHDKSYFCYQCNKGYDCKERHKCNNTCRCCRKVHSKEGAWAHCQECNRYFMGEECYLLHKHKTRAGNSTCASIYRCKECGQTVNRKKHTKEHNCGEMYCSVCNEYFLGGHRCFMKPFNEKNEKQKANQKFIFFDFECAQDKEFSCEKGFNPDPVTYVCTNCNRSSCGAYEHQPNLCITQKVCGLCMHSKIDEKSTCTDCGLNQRLFYGSETVAEFCTWLFSAENKGATVLCHNFKGYDSYPVIQFCHKNGIKPNIIANGTKIMSLEIAGFNIRMIDSLNFMPAALAKLPKMFDFKELCKGYFPHLINKSDNHDLAMNELPEPALYNPEAMNPDERAKFMSWYQENKHLPFVLKDELIKYCQSDVDILRKCCLKFRDLFMSISSQSDDDKGVDPLQSCITIASACNLLFRRNFLKPETIALIPEHGYRNEDKQSFDALRWLLYMSHSLGKDIQHARNGGELIVGKYKLDGYYEDDGKKLALEFHGCFWHGCTKCYARETVNPINRKTMLELQQQTMDKERDLTKQGFEYICKWECEFKKEMKNNEYVAGFVAGLDLQESLQPRDAFFGGRTEAFTLHQALDENTKTIEYYDVTSLYPWVNKYGKYPVGHPNIITEDFEPLETYEGIIKCKVLPPRRLLIPLLPLRANNKLLFPLCKTCADTQQQTPCDHANDRRAFIGTWVTDEVKKAISVGYQIIRTYEVWHYDEISHYNAETRTGGLFADYINTFAKVKQEASDWPAWCKSDEQKQQYIDDYYEREGIQLSDSNISQNPGLRSLAKLMLNSFWGKFGQRQNMTQVEYVTSPMTFYDLLTSDKQEVQDVCFVNDETVEVRWRYKENFVASSKRTNVVIAAYTTAQARLKLYSYLEKLGPRALYADTDSIIFTTSDNDIYAPPLGDYLGDLTNEIDSGRITEFVTGGPKNYAYKVKQDNGDVSTVCKVRGITLNYKNSLAINFDSLKHIVTESQLDSIVVTGSQIARKDKSLLTIQQSKKYRFVFDKRVIVDSFRTLPYGY